MIVTRIRREQAGVFGTLDGYLYRWQDAGDAIDVLPQHQDVVLLAVPDCTLVEVEVVDPPHVLPAVLVVEEYTDTSVPAAARSEGPQDLTGVPVDEPVLPEPEPAPATAVPPTLPEDGPEDLTGVPVDEPVLPEPEPAPDVAVAPEPRRDHDQASVRVTDKWSHADLEHVLEHRGPDGVTGKPSR